MNDERPQRFSLSRGGILNVWQYDDQVFDFGGGRLLLRGTNGAGKSKTLEMLLPFVIDGDKAKITASGRHHTSLLWLMLDGYTGANRTGYLWVEFARPTADGGSETLTCGIGLRASDSARTATTWYFTSPRRVGVDLHLTDAAGPLSMQRLRAEVETDGHFFDPNATRRYREHVGQLLFGLPLDQYEDLLRLLYWLRQPQVGEDIDPKRLAEQLVQALPQIDESALRSAGDTFDQLEEFGEQIDRQERAAAAIGSFLQSYRTYARGVVAERAQAVVDAADVERRARREVRRLERAVAETLDGLDRARAAQHRAESELADAAARITQLKAGPEARAQAQLLALDDHLTTRLQLADQAERRLVEQQQRVSEAQRRATDAAVDLVAATTEWVSRARTVRAEGADAGIVGPLARVAHLAIAEPDWRAPDSVVELRAALAAAPEELLDVRDRVGVARAAVKVVDAARGRAEDLRSDAVRREEDSARAETTLAGRQARHDEAVTATMDATEQFVAALTTWLEMTAAVPVPRPEISAEELGAFGAVVADAVAPVRAEAEQHRADARARLAAAEGDQEQVRAQRAEVAAERDPRPAPPVWRRDDRGALEAIGGAPFWRLVDFRDDIDAPTRAAVEAALEGSGLLDAWVTAEGRVVPEVEDAFLIDGSPEPQEGTGRSLAAVLRADSHLSGAVPSDVVDAVLSRVGLVDDQRSGAAPDDDSPDGGPRADRTLAHVRIGLDGSWRAGPLVGRSNKERAQFIGAAARDAERSRRLAALDGRLDELGRTIAVAGAQVQLHTATLQSLDAWHRARPSHEGLLTAWAAEQASATAVDEARAELAAAARLAQAARAAAAVAHDELVRLGQIHDLPITAQGLHARDERLRAILDQTRDLDDRRSVLERDLAEWEERGRFAVAERERLDEAADDDERARTEAATAAAELDELRAAAGASVAELELRLEELATTRDRADAERREQVRQVEQLVRASATLESEHRTAAQALGEATPRLGAARDGLVRLERAPGVIASATTEGHVAVEASSAAYDHWTPDEPRAILAALGEGGRSDDTPVISASQGLLASAAATLEPRLAKVEDVWVAFGLGEGGELPLVALELQLSATVRANRELLSQRERQIFEEQVLGYLGDALRGVRLKAEELVAAMNSQLRGVTTSQGIRVRLRWRQRDDIAADAKRAVELLGQPVGALLPSERIELRESLHRLIDSSRSEAPEESYAEHLSRALDYRRWFAFSVQYHRPETGEWRDLQRKSALSQGEQKVLCYLPLFAAASAHFTSLAGAAPHAPRFVLLDDAFPKIDARTHPLLFGLLVDLDLDFVVTSERLWGTHATVPELAIYEALRSPGERGIAQFEHRWDGQQLTAVGAGRPAASGSAGGGDG